MKQHHIIYVPGITDDTLKVQSILIQWWRFFGVRPHLQAMPWLGAGAFEPKLQKLLGQIDRYHQQGHKVSLVGASAGASAVLHAYDKRKDKISSLVYICGKINRPEAVSDRTYSENPAFKESLYGLPAVLSGLATADKIKMLSLYSKTDTTVPYADTLIEGVAQKQLPSFRHGWAIVYAISLGSLNLCKFLKQQP